MNGPAAEQIAIKAFQWLSADEELIVAFLGQSGADMADLSAMAVEPDFLASALDFVLSSDDLVRGFCDAIGCGYEVPGHARQILPGAEQLHWT